MTVRTARMGRRALLLRARFCWWVSLVEMLVGDGRGWWVLKGKLEREFGLFQPRGLKLQNDTL